MFLLWSTSSLLRLHLVFICLSCSVGPYFEPYQSLMLWGAYWSHFSILQDNKHTIILMQTSHNRSSRTFMDYESISQAMDGRLLFLVYYTNFSTGVWTFSYELFHYLVKEALLVEWGWNLNKGTMLTRLTILYSSMSCGQGL